MESNAMLKFSPHQPDPFLMSGALSRITRSAKRKLEETLDVEDGSLKPNRTSTKDASITYKKVASNTPLKHTRPKYVLQTFDTSLAIKSKVPAASRRATLTIKQERPLFDHQPDHALDTSSDQAINRTFPPAKVRLSDYNLGRVCESGLKTAERATRYPEDFDGKGLPLRQRDGRGAPAYVQNRNGDTCYAVVYGTTQLHGQEGSDNNYSAQVKFGPRLLSTKMKAGHIVEKAKRTTEWRKEWNTEVQRRTEEAENPVGSEMAMEHDNETSETAVKSRGQGGLLAISMLPSDSSEDDEAEPTESALVTAAARHIDTLDEITVRSLWLLKDMMLVIRRQGGAGGKPERDALQAKYVKIHKDLTAARAQLEPEILKSVKDEQAEGWE